MRVFGAKGGSGESQQVRAAREAPNTLQSKNTARVIDLIGEGVITGLVNGYQSVFFDDTPLQAKNGTWNFKGVSVEARYGGSNQSPLKGFPFIENEVDVGTKVEQATPVVRTVTDENVDSVRVKIRIPQLLKQDPATGDINTTSVQFDIHVQNDGGSYERVSLAHAWRAFSGTVTPNDDVKGLRVTVKGTLAGPAGTYDSKTLSAEYRAVGAGSWTSLGSKVIKKQLTVQGSVSGISSGLESKANYQIGGSRLILNGNDVDKTVSMEVSTTFEITGLSANDYEIRATNNNEIVKAEQLIPTYITISGKHTSPYEASFRVPLDEGEGPWNVKVTRITADSASSLLQNEIYWSTYTEVIDAKLRYNDSALFGLSVDAELFGSSVPVRSYEVFGTELRIPSNYDPETRVYDGVWDGTFQTAWTDNPAWVLYNCLINTRWGLGKFITESQVDKFALYDIGVYCDEMIDDGFGGTEPRFVFNGVFNTRREAFDVINAICSAFRGMAYWGSGTITVTQDSPADPVKLVTPANVLEGRFDYSGSALKSRHTVALVSWNDPNNAYKPTIEIVEDKDQIAVYGWNQTDIVAVGCTSRGQARRYGKWILDSEKTETELVTYRASLDHIDTRPGDIVAIADPNYAEVRMGGRIASATTTSITIDEAIDIESGETYSVSVTMPDGSIAEKDLTNAAANGVTVLTWTGALSDTPLTGAMWVVTASNVEPRKFRVISIREIEKNIFEVAALFHDPTKYDRVESDIVVEIPDYSLLPTGDLSVPTGFTVEEYKYRSGINVKSAVTLSWELPVDPRVGFFEVQYKGPEDEEYRSYKIISGNSIDFLDTTQGDYSFQVRSLDNLGGMKSEWVESTFEILGLYDNPSNVENFNISVINASSFLSWDPIEDLDLSHYVIKFSPVTSGATWSNSGILFPRVAPNSTSLPIQTVIGSYLIKAVDTVGKESVTEAIITTTIASVLNLNVITTVNEHTAWGGTNTNTTVVSGALRLNSADSIDDWDNVDEIVNFDIGNEGIVASGIYEFASTLDIGGIYTSRLTSHIEADGGDLYDNMDLWDNVDEVENWDGSDPSKWQVVLQIKYSDDNVSYSEWGNFIIGDYTARYFKFRLLLYSYQDGISPLVTTCSIQVDMPDRVVAGNDLTTVSGVKVVTFSPAFKETPAIGIGAQNMATGDYFVITSKSATGFTITFYNSGGTPVDRTFDYVAKGYGHLG